MISQSISDSNSVGFEIDVNFTDYRMVTCDLFAVEYACECLVLLVIVDGGVVVVEGEFLPFAKYG